MIEKDSEIAATINFQIYNTVHSMDTGMQSLYIDFNVINSNTLIITVG